MAPVPLKFVVSFSSQDDRHPVGNLLSGNGKKRWLSAPKLKTGQIEAVFELERPCVITHIDIGSVWCANIEVQVGWSSWAQGIPYKTMVATANLMSPVDCRNSNAFIKTRMFNASDFMEDVRTQEWDRIRIICRQPFRKDVQFGLSFIRITGNFSDNNNTHVQSPNRNTNRDGNPTQSSPFTGAKTPRMEDVISRQSAKTTPARTAELQNRLLKIASSAENGSANEVSMSRTVRLVLAAADQSPKFSPTIPSQHNHKSRLLSNSVDSRTGPSFKAEVNHFLSCLQLTEEDLSTITIADLRHRLEKRKRRKLTCEEKKTFISQTQEFLQAKFENDTDEPENDGDTDKFLLIKKRKFYVKRPHQLRILEQLRHLVRSPRWTVHFTSVPSGTSISSSVNTSTTTTATTTTKRKIAAKGSSSRKNCKIESDYKTRTVTVKVPSSAKRVPSSQMITVHCIECGKMVPEPNYLLHQVRCKNLSKTKSVDKITTPGNPRAMTVRTPVYQTPPDIGIHVDEWRSPHIHRMVTCPICQQNFPEADIQVHANLCAEL
ncbi:LOW QUALITY PROTEIN: uncharacterized protein LOC135477115 [Liolophura sinensis]|uniref:LOW QUALITY PROTEIN: uncharacterized protein LOC135477115 n=1 Tax=Liolophura sinensis TaxID=3198878 RepID=UPI0031593B1A